MEPPSDPPAGAPPPSFTEPDNEDAALANTDFLTRIEVLKRRHRLTKRLKRCYKDYLWSLAEEVKLKHREYYWWYGKSPFRDDDDGVGVGEERENGAIVDNGVHINGNRGFDNGGDGSMIVCAFPGCKSKAMALSRFCLTHILSDTKQKLYKGCKFCLKSTGAGPILCGRPILVSTIPSLCSLHVQRAEKNLRGILKKEGAPVALSNRLASKFHLVITEYVNLIQNRRRAAASVNIDDHAMKDVST